MARAKGWRRKYTLGALRKRVKDLPKSDVERAAFALKKRQERERDKEKVAVQRKLESASCADLEWLKRFCSHSPERPGCWIWTGPWRLSHEKPKPLVRRGEYGRMLADRAMWLALGRTGLVKPHYLRTSCGDPGCIAPDHLFVTNQTLERARAALGRPTEIESVHPGPHPGALTVELRPHQNDSSMAEKSPA